MVFFNCNSCGEALKKNQVEKHVLRCRNCQVLSCVDCGKDFWGNDYQSHTKCMTEEEKYCGQGYVSKEKKGEVKQEQWIEKVQKAIDKASANPNLRTLLIKLKEYPNIPRKQQKFQNFLKNSLRIRDERLIAQVWDLLMTHSATENGLTKNNNTANAKAESSENSKDEKKLETAHTNTNGVNLEDKDLIKDGSEDKKSKRERKEERRNKANKKEKKDKVDPEQDSKEKKKSKKRKHKDDDDEAEASKENGAHSEEDPDQPRKKKKKKFQTEEQMQVSETEDEQTHEVIVGQQELEEPKKKKQKFNWEATIIQVLETKGEISLKKLRKKVLGEFAALDAANYSEENLSAKFEKKVNKMSNVQILKERAKLKGK